MFYCDHIALNVSDLTRSKKFYEIFGGRVTSRPASGFMEMRLGEVVLHLLGGGAGDKKSRPCIDHFAVKVGSVTDLENVVTAVNSFFGDGLPSKVAIQKSPPKGEGNHVELNPPAAVAYFRDPDGNGIEVRAYHD